MASMAPIGLDQIQASHLIHHSMPFESMATSIVSFSHSNEGSTQAPSPSKYLPQSDAVTMQSVPGLDVSGVWPFGTTQATSSNGLPQPGKEAIGSPVSMVHHSQGLYPQQSGHALSPEQIIHVYHNLLQPPTPEQPTSYAPTPQPPTLYAQTPQPPTSDAPTPQPTTSNAPTPQPPTSYAPTPQQPTPDAPTPQPSTSLESRLHPHTSREPALHQPTPQPTGDGQNHINSNLANTGYSEVKYAPIAPPAGPTGNDYDSLVAYAEKMATFAAEAHRRDILLSQEADKVHEQAVYSQKQAVDAINLVTAYLNGMKGKPEKD
ncbi:hypothetical protein RF11_00430 [Thelohanellus kitauei]|uniref:Uncharacterized protein n=1 Tax=Thelohanellus kitauei TaxID=669202 RepID=A0A0C2MZJ9_THEKT|nr:hypothetical protein RF11_00430 [Thelohanellus kitauei]